MRPQFVPARIVNTGKMPRNAAVEASFLDDASRAVASDRLDREDRGFSYNSAFWISGLNPISRRPRRDATFSTRGLKSTAGIGSRRVPGEIAVEGDVRGLIVLNE